MKFKQSAKEFFTSKTNWGTIIFLAFQVYGYTQGQVDFQTLGSYVSGALVTFGLRDALAK